MKHLSEVPIIGIIRGAETGVVESAAAAAVKGGLRCLEITLNRPEACEQIAALRKKFGDTIEIGAGTVLDAPSAQKALDAGAEFIVTPALLPEVIAFCRGRKVPVFPGAMTPTEILSAHLMGATMVKVFPASVLGPAYVRSLRGPFPTIPLLPTGGVSAESAADYLAAGANALGVGGELFVKQWMAKAEWDRIEAKAREYVNAVMSWKKK